MKCKYDVVLDMAIPEIPKIWNNSGDKKNSIIKILVPLTTYNSNPWNMKLRTGQDLKRKNHLFGSLKGMRNHVFDATHVSNESKECHVCVMQWNSSVWHIHTYIHTLGLLRREEICCTT
jgi:hypothetical protein